MVTQTFRRPKRWPLLVLGLCGLLLTMVMAASVGSVSIPLADILKMIARRLPGVALAADWPASWETVFFQIRLSRILLAGMVGGSLAISGAVYQALFRNPLADPYLIGVSSGAALGATIAIAFAVDLAWWGLTGVPLMAFLGALAATTTIYLLARVGGRTPVATLLLAGVALGAFLSSISSFIMFRVNSTTITFQIVAWLMGSFALSNWRQVLYLVPYVLAGLVLVNIYARPLNVLQLDEDQAQQLGLEVERVKVVLVVAASLTTAAAVAVSGVIGFVGLIVPHAVRLLWGPDHRFLLPMSFLVGAIFLIGADSLARTLLSPSELPVGVITAFCGAPFFLYLLRQRKRALF